MSGVVHLDRKSTVEYLESALQSARDGDLVEVVIIGKRRGGETYLAASGSYNCHEMAGKILDAAVLRLGYQPR